MVGMVKVNVPAVTVCDPKVKTATALSAVIELLYKSMQSNAAALVRVGHDSEALGVQNATIPVPPVLAGTVALVTAIPPAV